MHRVFSNLKLGTVQSGLYEALNVGGVANGNSLLNTCTPNADNRERKEEN